MKDILKEAISSHYSNKDYTEVIRDSILCLMSEIRKKSDLVDNDGVDLINKAFSENNPLIKINKLETTTDKNKHRGIMDLSKGLTEYFRNPMSHSKQEYSKDVADAILVLLDKVILEEIIGSKSVNSIEDWYLEIVNDLSPNTERYARNLVLNIPESKYYDLSVMLYKNRNNISKKKDKIINELVISLSEEEYKEYCSTIEKDLFGNITENTLISSLKFITPQIWEKFSDLLKSKIEDIIFEDICKYKQYCIYNDYGDFEEVQRDNGYILENSLHIINNFSNIQEIINNILDKINDENEMETSKDYLIDNYSEIIIKGSLDINKNFIDYIIERLSYKHKPSWSQKIKNIVRDLNSDNKWFCNLAKPFGIISEIECDELELIKLDEMEELPF